jgi:RNA-binding protein
MMGGCVGIGNRNMDLTERQKRYLRKLGHELKPVVMTGADGLKPTVLGEIDLALDYHELIKIKVRAADRRARDEMIGSVCDELDASLIQRIGHVALLYRPNAEDPKLTLPR